MATTIEDLELHHVYRKTRAFPNSGFYLRRKDLQKTTFPDSDRLRRLFKKACPGEKISIHRRKACVLIYMRPHVPLKVRKAFLASVAAAM